MVLSFIPTIFFLLLLKLWSNAPGSSFLFFLVPVTLLFSWLSFRLVNKTKNSKRAFDQAVNEILVIETFSVMGLSGSHAPVADMVFLHLDESELITEARNDVTPGDQFTVKTARSVIFVEEIKVNNVVDLGKYQYTKHIFNGYLVSTKLQRTLTGKTFVSTEGDDSGFGHASFWTKLFGGKVNKTVLEWNEFENLLHVATTDETEARYVLTPDFMQNLYDWWKEQKTNIRLSFIGEHMYILFPDKKVRVDSTVSGLSKRKVRKYMFTIARPLMHVVNLVEGVRG